jgi:3-oxoacyl-[acyl-carrier protein] reductase
MPEHHQNTPTATRSAAIVTGAARGIGAEHAQKLVESGHLVVLNDVDEAELTRTVDRLGGLEVAIAVPGDISQTATARELVSVATEGDRWLDVVINNAGVIANKPMVDITDDDLDRIVAVNLRGPFVLSREAARFWRDAAVASGQPRRATLLNTTSRAALLANPQQTNYGAAKAGVAVMTQILARELRPYGVRCNVIAPRAYTQLMREGLGDFLPSAIPDWSPARVAQFADFLCGPAAAGITGQIFVVHGWKVCLTRTWGISDPLELDFSMGPDSVLHQLDTLFAGDPTAISEFEADDFPLVDKGLRPFKVDA